MSVRGGWDDRSSYREAPQRYTTVKQYRIPRQDDVEEKVSIYETDRRSSGRGSGFEETRIVRRERDHTPESRMESRYERAPEPRRVEREYRYERDVERPAPRREPYELDRYTRTTEYFPPAPRAPVVVPVPLPREEEDYQLIRRSEVIDDRQQLVRREVPREEEDYYYERRVREVEGDRHEDEYRSRRGRSNESASRRDYSSDDSMVYVKRETREERGGSPHHKRHLAEGIVAGVGAAELIRHHRRKSGDEPDSRGSRLGKDLAAGAVGAVGAEVISRVRSRHRSKSRHGSPDRGRHGRREKEHRSRSRSRVKQLAILGLGAAGVAAAVGYARHKNSQNKEKNKPESRQSRSRTRRNSTSAVPDDDPRNPGHRNTRMAQAGLAGAAIAGLVERARSKSRGGRSRSHSRLRQGIPIAAAGLGSAAIAGLYERRKANQKEEQAREAAETVERKRSRSRSRSTAPYDGPRGASASDPGLIEYGEAPVYSNGGIPDYYNRPASQAGYYQPGMDPAMVPAAAAGAYGATRVTEVRERVRDTSRDRERDRDGDRRREYSSESDDGERRRRHRRRKSGDGGKSRSQSRTREFAAAGLAAGAAAIGATQYQKRKERKKAEEREREQHEADHPGYEGGLYSPGPYSPMSPGAPPPPLTAPEYHPDAYYPATNQFPPPPNVGYSPQPAYNPAEYAPPNAQAHPAYGYPPQEGYTPPQGPYSPLPVDPYGQAPPAAGGRRGEENVSAEPHLNTTYTGPPPDARHVEEGLNTPRGPSPRAHERATSQPAPNKSVQFDFDQNSSNGSPDRNRHRRRRTARDDYDSYDSESSIDHGHRSNRRSRRHHDEPRTPSPAPSDETIELPARFDDKGRRKPERGDDPIADKIEEFLAGKGSAGKLFKNLTDGLLGGGGAKESNRDRRRR
ncbi:hypothetical protein MMC15_001758 [Xylographa vitiligo]|nr:hypothetical protein [Xylographa vitiligo]